MMHYIDATPRCALAFASSIARRQPSDEYRKQCLREADASLPTIRSSVGVSPSKDPCHELRASIESLTKRTAPRTMSPTDTLT